MIVSTLDGRHLSGSPTENLEKIAASRHSGAPRSGGPGIHDHHLGDWPRYRDSRSRFRVMDPGLTPAACPGMTAGVYAASRYSRGEAPNSAWNVRVKFDRSSKPTSSAMSVTGVLVLASFPAAPRSRARRSH